MLKRESGKASILEIKNKLQFTCLQHASNILYKKFVTFFLQLVISSLFAFNAKAQIVFEDNNFPDVKIYEVTGDIFADVVVYKAPNSIFTGINNNTGVWYFTDNPSVANIKVGYVSSGIFADIKVYYTTSNIFAHWNNEEKRKWFASKLMNYRLSFYDTPLQFVSPLKPIFGGKHNLINPIGERMFP